MTQFNPDLTTIKAAYKVHPPSRDPVRISFVGIVGSPAEDATAKAFRRPICLHWSAISAMIGACE
jgi:hypothetical protein